jgi:methionyl-tRNA formyltransferase
MKIVFFGTPDFVNPVLNKLEEKFEVVKKITTPQKMDDQFINELKILNPDIFVVAAYGQILPEKILSIPTHGAINIHPSLLPKYRGPSPIQTAILNGDKKTGVTFIKMDKDIDHGPIIEQFEEDIEDDDTFETLAIKLFQKSADAIDTVIMNYSKDQKGKPQDDSKATFTKTLTKQDGYIDVSSLEIRNLKLEIDRKIRAYFPWPGIWAKFKLNDKELIIKLLPNEQIQVEGKKPMSFKDFINGYPNGKTFLDRLSIA